MKTKEEIYEDCTRKHLGNNPNGTRMDIVYDAMEQYRKEGNRFNLTPSEQEAFERSGSKAIMFEYIGGIGIGVSYLDSKGKWIDITDYDSW